MTDIFLGGDLAVVFLKVLAEMEINSIEVDTETESTINQIENHARRNKVKFHFPEDFLIGDINDPDTHVFVADATLGIAEGLHAMDIGPQSSAQLSEMITRAKIVFWSGNLGYISNQKSREGTIKLVQKLTERCQLRKDDFSNIFVFGSEAEQMLRWAQPRLQQVPLSSFDSAMNSVTVVKSEDMDIIFSEDSYHWLTNSTVEPVDDCKSEAQSSTPSNAESCAKKYEIFAGGLPSDTTEAGLLAYFSQFGEIESCSPQYWGKPNSKNKKCRGYGIIVCKDETTFERILSQKMHKFKDRRIECKKKLKKQKLAKYSKELLTRKIFVSGLPSYVTSARLEEIFNTLIGPVEIAYVIKHRKSKKSRGFGYVVFKNKEDRQKVLEKREFTINSRTVVCKAYESKDDISKKDRESRRQSMHHKSSASSVVASELAGALTVEQSVLGGEDGGLRDFEFDFSKNTANTRQTGIDEAPAVNKVEDLEGKGGLERSSELQPKEGKGEFGKDQEAPQQPKKKKRKKRRKKKKNKKGGVENNNNSGETVASLQTRKGENAEKPVLATTSQAFQVVNIPEIDGFRATGTSPKNISTKLNARYFKDMENDSFYSGLYGTFEDCLGDLGGPRGHRGARKHSMFVKGSGDKQRTSKAQPESFDQFDLFGGSELLNYGEKMSTSSEADQRDQGYSLFGGYRTWLPAFIG